VAKNSGNYKQFLHVNWKSPSDIRFLLLAAAFIVFVGYHFSGSRRMENEKLSIPSFDFSRLREEAAEGAIAQKTCADLMFKDNSPQDQLEKALKRDEAVGQYCLGLLYSGDYGVPQDSEAAKAWYKRAAEQNFPAAQYSLGVMYLSEGDKSKGKEWLLKADANGFSAAKVNLSAIDAYEKIHRADEGK
jgi:TPR repeat protein